MCSQVGCIQESQSQGRVGYLSLLLKKPKPDTPVQDWVMADMQEEAEVDIYAVQP